MAGEIPGHAGEAEVRKVEMIHGTAAYVYYAASPARPGVSMTKVYRRTWAEHPGYWPPGVGDIFDPESGTLVARPRSL